MRLIRSPRHPGLRVLPDRGEEGIGVQRVEGPLAGHLRAGDRILAVDGRPVRDVLDFHFYAAHAAVPRLRVRDAAGAEREEAVSGELLDEGGLAFAPMTFKTCGNDCVFCFIHQMPKGLRQDLYFMDEDYRLGFLYGNYVTLALARDEEIARIIEQRMNPVYLSVHSTDMAVRNRMLGLKRSRDIGALIRRLLEGGITIHGQIVLVPGYNDGAELDRTLDDLAAFAPGIESVGIVPVGLTRHRAGLTPITGFAGAVGYAAVIDQVEARQRDFSRRLGTRFAHLADEFYLQAGRELPAMADYEEFFLIDNGIGMSRDFVDRVREEMREWQPPARPLRAGLLTGRLGRMLFERYLLAELAALPGLSVTVRALDNRLFGDAITVSGLLAGRELLAGLAALPPDLDCVVLPPNTLNAAQVFLDDLSLEEFRRASPLPVLVPPAGLLGALREHLRSADGAL